MKRVLAAVISGALLAHPAMAQDDDFSAPPPPPNMGDAPLPPGAAPRGNMPRGANNNNANPSDKNAGTGLTAGQKTKFADASPEDITNENFPEQIESFDYPNAEITDLIKAMGELTGKNFIIDPGVRGKITIIAPSRITVAEAYKAFLSALAINGFTIVPSGKFLKVKSARNAQRDSIETYSGAYFPNTDQMITRIIHLKHISAEQVNRDLRILPSKDGEMSVYTPTNSIILSDYGSNIERVMKIINQLDVPGFEEQLKVIPIKYAKAKDLADLVDQIVNKGEKRNTGGRAGSFTAGVPRFNARPGIGSSQGNQGNATFMVIPDDRTNALIIVGNKSGIERVQKLVAQLDFKISPEENGGVNVYYVKNGDAEKIAQTLSGIAKDAGPKAPTNAGPGSPFAPIMQQQNQEVFGGDVKIVADKNTNSLVITASKQDYETVLNLLAKIDIPRDQVYVEAIIMEMNANDSNAWGVGYYKFDEASGGMGRAGFNGLGDLTTFLSPTGGTGAVLGFASGNDVKINGPNGTTTTVKSLTGFINFVKTVTKTNILSTPQITAIDNEEASIEVGDKIPTGTTQNTNNGVTTTTPNFENVSVALKIKPFINHSSDTIRMEIDQKVKQPTSKSPPKALADSTVIISDRSIKTNVVVNNGDTAVLGGLIKDQEIEQVTKVPLLGDIPIIGWLFKSKTTSTEKVNLVVFITPKIVRNPATAKSLVNKKLDERISFVKKNGGRDPFGEKADEVRRSASAAGSVDTAVPAPAAPNSNDGIIEEK